jgi:hypothetical protein
MKYEVADLPEGPMNFLADWTVEFFGGRGILWYWFFFVNFHLILKVLLANYL